MIRRFVQDLKNEFKGYNPGRFSKDLMAGLTVTAVALPLALAFGVGCGADAAAGLITAILSGLIISLLSGASYQISGPTGAMTAVLITIVSRYGLQGVFIACLMAGILLLVSGIFKFGKLISFIPAPVISGFTSGIAIIIALGQIDNLFGTVSEGETALEKLFSYGHLGFSPNLQALLVGVLVIIIMLLYPKKLNTKVPSSLVAIIIVGIFSKLMNFQVAVVGDIPKTLLPESRLSFANLNFDQIINLISPAFTIATLGMIESLLCGASGSRMKNDRFNADQELIAQGVGNIIIPFFGGVPSTAAIARTSVSIKSGCQTRLTGVIHSIGLLLCMFLLGDVMSKLPLAALAGVLMVTAYRMNEWESIHYIFHRKFKGAISKFLITMLATVVFDLTIAIIIGVVYSLFIFVARLAKFQVTLSKPVKKAKKQGLETVVAYLSGPLFFATAETFTSALQDTLTYQKVILSFNGVFGIDMTGAQALLEYCAACKEKGIQLAICGLSSDVEGFLKRTEINGYVPEKEFYLSVDKAI